MLFFSLFRSESDIVILVFFKLVFSWYIFSHPFCFLSSIALCSRFVFFNQHIYFTHFGKLYFLWVPSDSKIFKSEYSYAKKTERFPVLQHLAVDQLNILTHLQCTPLFSLLFSFAPKSSYLLFTLARTAFSCILHDFCFLFPQIWAQMSLHREIFLDCLIENTFPTCAVCFCNLFFFYCIITFSIILLIHVCIQGL
jgi:hypothetical protein